MRIGFWFKRLYFQNVNHADKLTFRHEKRNYFRISMKFYSDEQWLEWMEKLSGQDYAVVDDFIPGDMFGVIMSFFEKVEEKDKLKKAGIGTLEDYQIREKVRGDFIYWLERNRDEELKAFYELMDECTEALKRFCFVSLHGSEFHLAKYPPGTRYERHLDQFHERSNRQITVLIYLNKNWQKPDGGELKMFTNNGEKVIEPVAKRLLLFRSDKIEHEVLMTRKARYSLTGWLLHQPGPLGHLFG